MSMNPLTPDQVPVLLDQLKAHIKTKLYVTQKNFTDKELAKMLDCSEQALCQWKNRGLSGLRLQNIYLRFPELDIWKTTQARVQD